MHTITANTGWSAASYTIIVTAVQVEKVAASVILIALVVMLVKYVYRVTMFESIL